MTEEDLTVADKLDIRQEIVAFENHHDTETTVHVPEYVDAVTSDHADYLSHELGVDVEEHGLEVVDAEQWR